MSLTRKKFANTSMQKVNERNQATPPGIPIACLVAFSVVTFVADSRLIPFVLAVVDLRLLRLFGIYPFLLIPVPFLLLVIAEVLSQPRWRSALFSAASIFLMVEWLFVIGKLPRTPWVTLLTSLPFLVLAMIGNARSFSLLFRLDKRWTALP